MGAVFDKRREAPGRGEGGFCRFPPDERPDNENAHLHGLGAVQDVGSHESAVFREGTRLCFGKLETLEVVAICDHLRFLPGCQLKAEILRKTFRVAFDLLVEAFGRHSVKPGKIGIDQDGLAAEDQNWNGIGHRAQKAFRK